MKYLRFFVFALLLINFSCGEDDGPPAEDEILTPVFQMDIDGKKWEARDFYYKIENGIPRLYSTDTAYTLHWEFEDNIKAKSYVLGKSENELITSFYLYTVGKTYIYVINSGILNVDKIDNVNKVLSGTFNFNAEFEGKIITVTNGRFVIKNF